MSAWLWVADARRDENAGTGGAPGEYDGLIDERSVDLSPERVPQTPPSPWRPQTARVPCLGTAFDRDGFTRIAADADRERKERAALCPPAKRSLQLDTRPDRLPGRAEDAQRLVAAELDRVATQRDDDLAREPGELRREPPCLLLAVRLGEARVPADVCEQERMNASQGLLAGGLPPALARPLGDTTAPTGGDHASGLGRVGRRGGGGGTGTAAVASDVAVGAPKRSVAVSTTRKVEPASVSTTA